MAMHKFAHWRPACAEGKAPPRGPGEGLPLSRRGFLIGMAGAGATLAFARPGVSLAEPDAIVREGAWEPAVWYRIHLDGAIVVHVAEAEMGQHVGTALARIVAEELEADWNDVRLDHVDASGKWGYMVTGGSWSVHQNFDALSRAGAAGRIALIEEGARLLGVEASECVARDSRVRAGDASISYGEIVSRGNLTRVYTPEELEALPIKPAAQRRLIGQHARALDIPDKSQGRTVYGIDAEVEGMVYARPLVPPTRYGSRVVSVDDSAARDVRGYLRTLVLDDPSGTVPGWAVVVAESWHAADRAARAVAVQWEAGETAGVSEDDILARGRELIADTRQGALVRADEGVDEAFAAAADVLETDYVTHSVLHFQLEPLNATAFQRDDGVWEIHTGNQWQDLVLPTLATALGTEKERIQMRTYLLGGGFGRRLTGDYTIPAALASKALGGRPVKLVFSREDDARFDCIRSPSNQKVRMAFDGDGNVIAMEHHAAAGWPTLVQVPSFMPEGGNHVPYDPFSISGADHWYSVGAHRVRAVTNDLANATFQPGWLRSVGPGWTNWALESFMDEAAHRVGRDPIEFRLAMLKAEGRNAGVAPNSVGGAARQAGVLRRVRELSGWDARADLPADTGLGVATSFGQERNMPTWTACVARVHVDRNTGRVRLQKLTLVTDAGTIVSPDGARAQVEGAALWGASMALHEGTRIAEGQVADTNLDSYTPLRLGDVPALEIDFVDSVHTPVGLGEPATTVVAPAVANAIFAAVGVRLRDLPMTPADVKAALDA